MLRAHIAEMLRSTTVPRKLLERVIGVEGHLCAVLAEGKLALDSGYAFMYAKRPKRSSSYKPHAFHLDASNARAAQFCEAQRWFDGALQQGVSVPLAPRLTFPDPGVDDTIFVFVDASRDWGIGGWTVVRNRQQPEALTMIALTAPYPPPLTAASRDTGGSGLSTAAIEIAAADIMLRALGPYLTFRSAVIFTDSEAARGAINAGSSMAPRIRPLVASLYEHSLQLLAVRVSTTQNKWADDLSRNKAADVFRQAAQLGWSVRTVAVPARSWDTLCATLAEPAAAPTAA